MKRRVAVTVMAIAACSGLRSPNASTAAFTSADSAAIAGVNDRMQIAARAGDWDAWGAEFTADPERLPPNIPPLVGKAAADAFNRASPTFSTFDITLTSVAGEGDLAVATGTFAVHAPAGKDSAGKPTPPVTDQGKFMQTLRRQADGTWKVARDIWNSDLPVSRATAPVSQ